VLKQTQKEASKVKGGLLNADITNQKALNKEVQTANTLIQTNAKATANKARVTKALTVEEAKLKEELRKANLESRQTARLQLAQEGSVEKLRAKLSILTREWDKLTDAERKNSDRGKRLKKGIDETTASVTKLEQSTGRHQRNVGNYSSALDGLKGKFRGLIGVASQFGLALGGVAILKNAITSVATFEQSIADLSAITGAGGKDLQFFKDQAIELGKTTRGGASAVVEAYKLIGSAKPELLENADALNQVTEAAITLAKASGLELPEAATRLTDAMNQFGAPAEQAGKFIDVLANGAKFGAAEIPQITDALLKFGAVAKTSNVSIEESTALIEALAEKGLKGAEAGTGLRNVMLKLSAPDALPKEAKDMLDKLGISFDKLKDTSLPFSERLTELKPLLTDNAALVKTFGTENAVVATTLLSNIDRVDQLTASMGELGTAQEQADIRSKTLGEAFSNLGNSWNSFILGLVNGENATEGLRGFIDYLAKNLPTIIGYIVDLGKVFLIYKARLIAINIAQKVFGDGAKGMNVSLKQMTTNFKEGAKAGTGFGGAMKSIGWAALIAFAYEFATALYDVASGAQAARHQAELYAEAQAKGAEQVASIRTKLNATYQDEINAINKARSLNQISDKEQQQQIKQAIKNQQLLLKGKISEVRSIYAKIQAQKESLKADIAQGEAGLLAGGRANPLNQNAIIQLEIQRESLRRLNADQKQARTIIDGLREDYHGYTQSVFDTDIAINDLTESTKAETKAIKEKKKELLGLTEAQKEYLRSLDVDQEIAINALEFNIEDAEAQTDAIIEEELKRASEGKAINIALVNDKIKEEERLKRELIEIQYQYDLLYAKSQSDIDLATQKRNQDLIRLDAEYAKRKVETLEELNNAQEEYSQKETEIIAETAKANYDEQKKWIQLTEKLLTDNLDKKIAILEKEIDARKTQADELRKLAENGNIEASQSIAEEERLANEALIKKEKLERRKQQIAMVSAFLQSYLTAVENGEKPAQALVTAGADKAVLESFINSLPAFIEGTNTTVADSLGAPMMSGEDGHVIRVDGREKILNPELSGMTGNLTTGQIAKLSQDYLNGKLVSKMDSAQQVGGSYMDSNAIIKSIQGLEQTIKNKPETEYNLQEVVQGVYSFTRKQTKGNTIIYNKYRV
jgi:TP901 family phage tail tape measure protein